MVEVKCMESISSLELIYTSRKHKAILFFLDASYLRAKLRHCFLTDWVFHFITRSLTIYKTWCSQQEP